jgi:hypothetical protein
MYYYRIAATGEVLGAAQSAPQNADWLVRYADALGVSGQIDEFESDVDPRPANARTEPAPEPSPEPSIADQIASMQAHLAALMAKVQ